MANYPDDPVANDHGVDTTTNVWHPISDYVKPGETVASSIARVARQNGMDGGFDGGGAGSVTACNPDVGTQSNQQSFGSGAGVSK